MICIIKLLSARHVQSFRHVREEDADRLLRAMGTSASVGSEPE
jgi:hypothetical protein